MTKIFHSLIIGIALICGTTFSASAEISDFTQEAIYTQSIPSMLKASKISTEDERAVVDVFCSRIDLSQFSYEQLLEWKNESSSKILSEMFSNALSQKRIEILQDIQKLTAEEFVAYTLKYPKRKEILTQYVQEIFLPNLGQLSLLELMYFDDYLPQEFHEPIAREIKKRDDEIRNILIQNESDYYTYEKKLKERLKYLIEYNLWTFFVNGHQELNEAYSQIGIVPDNAYLAAEQYQHLVKICFPANKIRELLQAEVDKYCKEINKAREDYYKLSGKEKYQKVSYKVPQFSLNTNVSVGPLWEVGEARERFIRNRENISTGTSVLGFFLGDLVGLIAQGIGDWMAIDGLVSSEYEARKKYMENVQESLIINFTNYADNIVKGIDKSL